jgi:uncharacterized membrane protein
VRWLRRQCRAPITPTIGAIVCCWLAWTPSLLPRNPFFQALVAAIALVTGYALGSLLGWVVRGFGGRLAGPARRRAWQVVARVGGVGSVVVLWLSLRWENQVRDLVGMDKVGLGHVLASLLLLAVLSVVLLGIARGLKALGRVIGRWVGRRLPAKVATLVGGLAVGLLAYQVVFGVLGSRMVAALDSSFMVLNDEFSTSLPAPTIADVSAGPASGEDWDDLGRQGRLFIANTPTQADIAAFSGREALQPVRAYIGAGPQGVRLRDEAARAADELERLGGFNRAVVNVVTGTGRGWVNENQAQALEFMWGGDTATVSMQYSYLPSWMSFLSDGDRAQDAGRALFDAIYARWLEQPEADRPLLVVSGESLGTFGGEAAFSGDQDLATRTDGALFVGPTNNNTLWSRFTAERDDGTPEVLPTFDGGATVRFADRPTDWESGGPWDGTRVGYLQHANDPITWWDWSLALHKPDWLSEPRGRDVSPHMHWIPLVTMVQLGAADQMVANSVPAGQGHQFGQEPVYAWASILPPPGWTPTDTDDLAGVIEAREPMA